MNSSLRAAGKTRKKEEEKNTIEDPGLERQWLKLIRVCMDLFSLGFNPPKLNLLPGFIPDASL